MSRHPSALNQATPTKQTATEITDNQRSFHHLDTLFECSVWAYEVFIGLAFIVNNQS